LAISAEEEKAAEFIGSKMSKPVASYIAGQTAPEGKKMGHAGAITSGNAGTAAGKMKALEAAGVRVAANPTQAGEFMVDIVKSLG
jgi:succinyl-CoA synthetase alpha subunit